MKKIFQLCSTYCLLRVRLFRLSVFCMVLHFWLGERQGRFSIFDLGSPVGHPYYDTDQSVVMKTLIQILKTGMTPTWESNLGPPVPQADTLPNSAV